MKCKKLKKRSRGLQPQGQDGKLRGIVQQEMATYRMSRPNKPLDRHRSSPTFSHPVTRSRSLLNVVDVPGQNSSTDQDSAASGGTGPRVTTTKPTSSRLPRRPVNNILDNLRVTQSEQESSQSVLEPERYGRRKKMGVKKVSGPEPHMNAVLQLDNIKKGLQYKLLASTGPVHAPVFTMQVEVNGTMFEGQGRTKKRAKLACAEKALGSFVQLPNAFQAHLATGRRKAQGDFSSKASNLNNFGANAALVGVGNQFQNGATAASLPLHLAGKNPVTILNEIRPGTKYQCVSETGKTPAKNFVMSVTVFNEVFRGTGGNKRLAKSRAAQAALQKIFNLEFSSAPACPAPALPYRERDDGQGKSSCSSESRSTGRVATSNASQHRTRAFVNSSMQRQTRHSMLSANSTQRVSKTRKGNTTVVVSGQCQTVASHSVQLLTNARSSMGGNTSTTSKIKYRKSPCKMHKKRRLSAVASPKSGGSSPTDGTGRSRKRLRRDLPKANLSQGLPFKIPMDVTSAPPKYRVDRQSRIKNIPGIVPQSDSNQSQGAANGHWSRLVKTDGMGVPHIILTAPTSITSAIAGMTCDSTHPHGAESRHVAAHGSDSSALRNTESATGYSTSVPKVKQTSNSPLKQNCQIQQNTDSLIGEVDSSANALNVKDISESMGLMSDILAGIFSLSAYSDQSQAGFLNQTSPHKLQHGSWGKKKKKKGHRRHKKKCQLRMDEDAVIHNSRQKHAPDESISSENPHANAMLGNEPDSQEFPLHQDISAAATSLADHITKSNVANIQNVDVNLFEAQGNFTTQANISQYNDQRTDANIPTVPVLESYMQRTQRATILQPDCSKSLNYNCSDRLNTIRQMVIGNMDTANTSSNSCMDGECGRGSVAEIKSDGTLLDNNAISSDVNTGPDLTHPDSNCHHGVIKEQWEHDSAISGTVNGRSPYGARLLAVPSKDEESVLYPNTGKKATGDSKRLEVHQENLEDAGDNDREEDPTDLEVKDSLLDNKNNSLGKKKKKKKKKKRHRTHKTKCQLHIEEDEVIHNSQQKHASEEEAISDNGCHIDMERTTEISTTLWDTPIVMTHCSKQRRDIIKANGQSPYGARPLVVPMMNGESVLYPNAGEEAAGDSERLEVHQENLEDAGNNGRKEDPTDVEATDTLHDNKNSSTGKQKKKKRHRTHRNKCHLHIDDDEVIHNRRQKHASEEEANSDNGCHIDMERTAEISTSLWDTPIILTHCSKQRTVIEKATHVVTEKVSENGIQESYSENMNQCIGLAVGAPKAEVLDTVKTLVQNDGCAVKLYDTCATRKDGLMNVIDTSHDVCQGVFPTKRKQRDTIPIMRDNHYEVRTDTQNSSVDQHEKEDATVPNEDTGTCHSQDIHAHLCPTGNTEAVSKDMASLVRRRSSIPDVESGDSSGTFSLEGHSETACTPVSRARSKKRPTLKIIMNLADDYQSSTLDKKSDDAIHSNSASPQQQKEVQMSRKDYSHCNELDGSMSEESEPGCLGTMTADEYGADRDASKEANSSGVGATEAGREQSEGYSDLTSSRKLNKVEQVKMMVCTRSRSRENVTLAISQKQPKKSSTPSSNQETGMPCRDGPIAKSACALWSSERRRYFQQQYGDISGPKLDELMCREWTNLTHKEKAPYYKRASNSLRDCDEIKALKKLRKENAGFQVGTTGPDSAATREFYKLSPGEQDWIILQRLVELQHQLPSFEYNRFLLDYIASWKKTKQRLKWTCSCLSPESRSPYLARVTRKLLFAKILDMERRCQESERHRAVLRRQRLENHFQQVTFDLCKSDNEAICDIHRLFEDNLRSEKLSDVLSDLNDTQRIEDSVIGVYASSECDAKTIAYQTGYQLDYQTARATPRQFGCYAADQATLGDADVQAISNIEFDLIHGAWLGSHTMTIQGDEVRVPRVVNTNTERELLYHACSETTLPVLQSDDVTGFFDRLDPASEIDHTANLLNGPGDGCGVPYLPEAPSSPQTDQHEEYRSLSETNVNNQTLRDDAGGVSSTQKLVDNQSNGFDVLDDIQCLSVTDTFGPSGLLALEALVENYHCAHGLEECCELGEPSCTLASLIANETVFRD